VSEDAGSGRDEIPRPLPQNPFVGRLKPDPSQPAQRVIDLVGLAGDSDRTGYQRLYLTTKLDYYAEFLVQDVVYSETVPADQSPFPGLEAARVSVRRDATINYTWARSPQPVDEFDLDVRLGAAAAAVPSPEGVTFVGCSWVCPTHFLCPTQVNTLCHQFTCGPCLTETRITCSCCKDPLTCQ
jgi:hypothetical protein